ncbi:hypothetical protein [Mycoplasma suis]|uniref:hypothetical protein n=1 Tax=Mycoplasma suis TaxID=57372 RepID=UPI001F320EBA|nr:hypothetical protein [Mycoplasma suis]
MLLPILGLGTFGGGSFAAYSFSDTLFPENRKLKGIGSSTTLDSNDLQDLKGRISSGTSTLIYEFLQIDGETKDCIKRVREGQESEPKNFQDSKCEGWNLSELGNNNKRVIWVKYLDPEQINNTLGQWFRINSGESQFKNNTEAEDKKLISGNSDDDSITFECKKSSMESSLTGKQKVEIKCIESSNNVSGPTT